MAVRLRKERVVESTTGHKYKIEGELSTGLFATSYLATDSDGQQVFFKQYKSPSTMKDWYEDYIQYQNELKRRVSSNDEIKDRTYKFVDFFEDKEKRGFYQVFEYIDQGKDLKAYLDDENTSVYERYVFASLFLYTLSCFHRAGIIHTDLKPDNVYLMKTDATKIGYILKLIDFDFPVLEGKKVPWHGDMNYCGTPRYMSPEHIRGEVPNRKSDVFTAALMCYELLAGGHPYSENEDEYNKAAVNGVAPKPKFIVPETSAIEAFGTLLMQSLSSKAEERPDISELHQALLSARSDFLNISSPPKSRPPRSVSPNPLPPKPIPKKTSTVIPIPTPPSHPDPKPDAIRKKKAVRLGLSMEGDDQIDWFKMTTEFGKHTFVKAVQSILPNLPSVQFVLLYEGNGKWLIAPPNGTPPPNLTTLNGDEVLSSIELKAGDIIGIGSRREGGTRVMYKMKVSLDDKFEK